MNSMNSKSRFGLAVLPALAGVLFAFSASSASAADLTTDQDKLSYAIGADIGGNFHTQNIAIEPNVFMQGLQDGYSGKQLALTEQQMQDVLKKFQTDMVAKRLAEVKAAATNNKKAGDAYQAANKKKSGVITLTDGLQYKVITKGTGAKPSKTDSVTVEYTGKLVDGTVFDSTEKTGKPITFKVNQVIPGWTQALQLMPAGSTWEVVIPPSLAYGERGVGGPIGPNETLVFTIHLISVKKA